MPFPCRNTLSTTVVLLLSLLPVAANAQLMAYEGRQTDNNCRIIYLVNGSADSIYYINNESVVNNGNCQTFAAKTNASLKTYTIQLSGKECTVAYELMLPKDTLSYQLIAPDTYDDLHKNISFFARNSSYVIPTNNNRKRARQINKLPGSWRMVAVTK